MKILLVDDEEIQLETLKRGLRSRGYRVQLALSAMKALQFLDDERNKLDLVITDYAMPGMNGLELLKRIRTEHGLMPVIMMTAYGSDDLLSEAAFNRCSKLIEKPFTLDELIRGIEMVKNQGGPKKAEPRMILPLGLQD